MALVLGGIGVFLHERLRSELNQSIDQDLYARLGELKGQIRVSDVGLGESARTALAARGDQFAQVLTGSDRLFDPGSQRPEAPVLDPAQARQADRGAIVVERTGVPGLGGQPVRLLATPIRFERRSLIVIVGTSLAGRDKALDSLRTLLLLGLPAALLLASLAAYWTVGAALRPVEAMRSRAAEISAAESSGRLPVPPARDELHRLGETLNRMLDRLQAAMERERSFVDDASHELRTPLALHKSELELALRYGESPEELRASIASAIEEADRLSQLAENLLVLARADGDGLALRSEALEVGDLFATLSERLGPRARDSGRELSVESPNGLVVHADRVRAEQALTNVAENALRHGQGDVRVFSRIEGGRVELHVTDEGPGFPPAFLPHAFERFRRADPARGEGGTGLGLAIVEAIAVAHGGAAHAANRPEGGADVWIELRRT